MTKGDAGAVAATRCTHSEGLPEKRILQFAGFADQLVELVLISGFGHLVAHPGCEHVGVAECSFDQRCEAGRDGVVSGGIGIADDVEDCVADELRGRDSAGPRGLFDLFPFRVGEADASVLAGGPVLCVVGRAGFGIGRIVDGHEMGTRGGSMRVSQEETDRYWDAIVGNGGKESDCGWCKDRWGVSWQITPKRLLELTTDTDRTRARRAFAAMMTMQKIDIAGIEAAAEEV